MLDNPFLRKQNGIKSGIKNGIENGNKESLAAIDGTPYKLQYHLQIRDLRIITQGVLIGLATFSLSGLKDHYTTALRLHSGSIL